MATSEVSSFSQWDYGKVNGGKCRDNKRDRGNKIFDKNY